MLTICPYLLKPLRDLSATNDEHIIPYAMGGSDKFVLRADKETNSVFGRTVDSDLIHDPFMRLMAATQGVKSRSGDVVTSFMGEVVGTSINVDVPFSKAGLGQAQIASKDRYKKDPETGKLTGIVGFDNQVEEDLARLGVVKKGKKWAVSDQTRTDSPLIKVEFWTDNFKVSRGLAKIAYLMACRTIGDKFVMSQSGESFRCAINAATQEEFNHSGITYLGAAELPLMLLPDIAIHEHLVACWNNGQFVLLTIKLFGCVAQATFIFPASDFALNGWDGNVVVNDARTRTIIERRFMDSMPMQLRFERMFEYHNRPKES